MFSKKPVIVCGKTNLGFVSFFCRQAYMDFNRDTVIDEDFGIRGNLLA